MHRSLPFALLAATFVVLSVGCSDPALEIWTNQASVAPVVDLFNASQDEFRAELRFVDSLYTEVRLAQAPPDVVIGTAVEPLHGQLRGLDDLLDGDPLSQDAFYRGQLEQLRWNGTLKLLPVSFNLPMVLFRLGDLTDTHGIYLDPRAMKKLATDHNRYDDERLVAVGYSPRWDRMFAYSALRIAGVQFTETNDALQWDDEALEEAVVELLSWNDGSDDWIGHENVFRRRYLYEPQPNLVRSGRIRFTYEASHAFFGAPQDRTRGLAFRWFGNPGSIPVLDLQTHLGIPSRATNTRGAGAFAAWLLSESTQDELLRQVSTTSGAAFGIAGGFSSLRRVNEVLVPRYYPELTGRIPTASWLQFPPPAPALWPQTRSIVILPWLADALAGKSDVVELREQMTLWYMQQER